jgi:hypothetical protein
MITEFNIFKMFNKNKKIGINNLNISYSGKSVTIWVPRKINRQLIQKEETYIIDKILYIEPKYTDQERSLGSLIIRFKSKFKKELEITKKNIFFLEEYSTPIPLIKVDETIQNIINEYKTL